eukprot:scaffold33222_cov129-Isochrysis_galbana.AAC.3
MQSATWLHCLSYARVDGDVRLIPERRGLQEVLLARCGCRRRRRVHRRGVRGPKMARGGVSKTVARAMTVLTNAGPIRLDGHR